jgi:hypothetical protein
MEQGPKQEMPRQEHLALEETAELLSVPRPENEFAQVEDLPSVVTAWLPLRK